jgi:predicted transcriptional regulator
MARPPALPGGELERSVLDALLELGRATARAVHDRMGSEQGLAYTTIATVLDRLHDKGLVHRRREGRAFVFSAAVARDALDRARARQVLDGLIGSDHKPAMAALVDAVESIDPALLDELARLVAARRRSR